MNLFITNILYLKQNCSFVEVSFRNYSDSFQFKFSPQEDLSLNKNLKI